MFTEAGVGPGVSAALRLALTREVGSCLFVTFGVESAFVDGVGSGSSSIEGVPFLG